MVELSHNQRSLRLNGQLTKFGEQQLLGTRPSTPPGILPDDAASAAESAAESAEFPLDEAISPATPPSSTVFGGSAALPSSEFPFGSAAVAPAPSAQVYVEQRIRPVGPTLRSRRGRGLVSTEAATLTPEELDYLKPLTMIDDVISTVERIEDWYAEWTHNCRVTKIAEGSFGSIFRLQSQTDPTQFTIGKLMPLRPKRGPGSKMSYFTRIQDAATEAEMLITMSNYQGFAEFRRAEVLHGPLPPALRQEYKSFEDEHTSKSKTTVKFGDNQLWLFLEMTYAGTDLEEIFKSSGTINSLSIRETWDIFWAVTLALARGEEQFNFEHRDLQIQNICIKRHCEFCKAQDEEDRMGIERHTNIEVTIIDYTLSRATLQDSRNIFNSMKDEAIFDGQGVDDDDTLQYETYRSMRQVVKGSSMALTRGHKKVARWETFVPATNVLWLYYLLKTLLRHTAKDTEPDDQAAREDEKIWSGLKQLSERLGPEYPNQGGYPSAMDLVKSTSHASEASSSFSQSSEGEKHKEEGDTEDEASEDGGIRR